MVVLAGALAGCEKKQVFQVKGVLQEVQAEKKRVKIAHEEIPDYMAAMTMEFEVKDARELAGLQPGDNVAFRMIVTDTDGWIDQVRKLPAASNEVPSVITIGTNVFRRVRDVEPLNEGDAVPDYRFTNQLGRTVNLSQFRGQALALTFIFTRCPFPTYCPRMSMNFEEAARQLKARSGTLTNWHLFSVSFDPEFDTPAVLKAYAQRYHADPRHWSFVTGDLIEITALTEQVGLTFWKPDLNQPANISHNLRTLVVNAQGRVQKILAGNEWRAEELVDEMVKAAAAK